MPTIGAEQDTLPQAGPGDLIDVEFQPIEPGGKAASGWYQCSCTSMTQHQVVETVTNPQNHAETWRRARNAQSSTPGLAFNLTKFAIMGDMVNWNSEGGPKPPPMYSDHPDRAALNQPNKLVPFRVQQPHGVLALADADALICNFDLRAMFAFLAEGKFDRFHGISPPLT
jgi:hypothetical protein